MHSHLSSHIRHEPGSKAPSLGVQIKRIASGNSLNEILDELPRIGGYVVLIRIFYLVGSETRVDRSETRAVCGDD